MIIGIPKELKDGEERIALLPHAVRKLVRKGHRVLVQRGAGQGSGYDDSQYRAAGAKLIGSIRELYEKSELIVKVKEPLPAEYRFFRPGLLLFCFLHLAANRALTRALMRSGMTALGFETLEDKRGQTPLLKPMSEIAGRLSALLGAHYLRTDQGGKGVLLSPTDYSEPGRVTVLGGGNVGRAAAEVAARLGAWVQVLDLYPEKLKGWAKYYPNVELGRSSTLKVARALRRSDLVIGAIYVPGAKTPQVIRKRMVQAMEKGSVLVDVAVDQGGTSQTTHPTTLSKPTYKKFGVIHCAVTNLPALVSRSASQVLSGAVLPYVLKVAEKNILEILSDGELRTAVNVSGGKIIHPEVLASLEI